MAASAALLARSAADQAVRPQVIARRPSVASAAPIQSGAGRSGLALSGTAIQASATAPAATGTLTRKMARQPIASTSQPPSKGATAPAIAPAAAQAPTAFPFASPSNAAPRMARLLGSSKAAPSP